MRTPESAVTMCVTLELSSTTMFAMTITTCCFWNFHTSSAVTDCCQAVKRTGSQRQSSAIGDQQAKTGITAPACLNLLRSQIKTLRCSPKLLPHRSTPQSLELFAFRSIQEWSLCCRVHGGEEAGNHCRTEAYLLDVRKHIIATIVGLRCGAP